MRIYSGDEMEAKDIIKYHKSEACFKCNTLVEKNAEGYFHCNCGFEWANLFIKRIPVQPFLVFKQFADKEFCSDYGLCFKKLIDDANGNNQMVVGLLEMMKEHDDRISKLENKPAKEIKTLSGKIIGGRESG